MTINASTQLTLDFTPGLTERYDSLLECIRSCLYSAEVPMKTIAADMDLSQSELSRKVSSNPDDKRKFSVDDLEKYIKATGDPTPIYFLIEKYLQDAEVKQKQAMVALSKILPELQAIINQATGVKNG